MKTTALSALLLSATISSANAAGFFYVKPVPLACSGAACSLSSKLAAAAAPTPPSGGAPTAPTPPAQAPSAPTPPAAFNPSLVMSQAMAVARASAVCFHVGGNGVSTAEDLAVTSAIGLRCLSSTPVPHSAAVGSYAWSVSQNFAGRTWTQAFQVRSTDAQTGTSVWSLVLVPGAPSSTQYRAYARAWVQSNGADVYPDGAQYGAFTYSAVLSGLTSEACTAVAAAGGVCSGGVMTAHYSAPSFSSVGSVSAGVPPIPSWASSTVTYP